jgi:hypothetical protein
MAIKWLCRKHGFSEASYYLWRGKCVDHKRVERQPLIRPGTPNE